MRDGSMTFSSLASFADVVAAAASIVGGAPARGEG